MKFDFRIPEKDLVKRQRDYEFVEKTFGIPQKVQKRNDMLCWIILNIAIPAAVSIPAAALTAWIANAIL